MLPPRPPSPPSGPPFGMNFSRRKLATPLPPWPALTSMVASSTNFMVSYLLGETYSNQKQRAPPLGRGSWDCCVCRRCLLGGNDRDGTLVQRAADVELDLAV